MPASPMKPHESAATDENTRSTSNQPGSPITDIVSSGQLLQGRSKVTIDHDGVVYVLSATRTGKLILTK